MKRTLNEEKERILEIMKNTSYLPDNVRDDDPHFTENPPWYDDEELDHWNIVDVEKGEQNNIFDDEKKVIVYGTLGGTATIYFSEIFDDGNFKNFNEIENSIPSHNAIKPSSLILLLLIINLYKLFNYKNLLLAGKFH